MHTIPAERLEIGMTIRYDDEDIFLTRVDVREKVAVFGVDLATGKTVTGVFDRHDELLWINQIHGEPAVPFLIAVQAIWNELESFAKEVGGPEVVYSVEAATRAIAQAIRSFATQELIV